MKRRGVAAMVALTIVAGVTGCATLRVNSYLGRGVDLQQYHTYNWAPADTWSTGDPRLDNNRFFDERVRAQVDKELARRGFEKTAAEQPDVLVHYHASVSQEIDIRDLDSTSAYCANNDCRPFIYDKGTLFVELVSPHTNEIIWRGWAEGSIDGVIDNQTWLESRIDEAVAKILTGLPHRL
jgi:hypothetical protein